MRLIILMVIACLALPGCGTLRRHHAAPVCDGKHRRPANPHGSVLDPNAAAQPHQLSAVTDLSYASCNG